MKRFKSPFAGLLITAVISLTVYHAALASLRSDAEADFAFACGSSPTMQCGNEWFTYFAENLVPLWIDATVTETSPEFQQACWVPPVLDPAPCYTFYNNVYYPLADLMDWGIGLCVMYEACVGA